jgi:hypothetical protein
MRTSTATLPADAAAAAFRMTSTPWDDRLQGSVSADPGAAGARLPALVAALIADQRRSWPLLREGYAAWAQGQARSVPVRATRVVLQHNPGRLRNTTADVAAAAAGARPCFLCPASLPPEERGIAFGDELVILCNPYPILDRHLSIAHRDHRPQRLEGWPAVMLALAESLGPEFFVLYNGPRCGASAPDHLHFQACARSLLPIAAPLAQGCRVLTPEQCGRSVIALHAPNRQRLGQWLEQALAGLPVPDGHHEPMVNLICLAEPAGLSAYLFPRRKHRPDAFHAPGEERLVVSPGAIDMAGVLVVPERRDFERLDGPRVEALYDEVTLPVSLVRQAAARIEA